MSRPGRAEAVTEAARIRKLRRRLKRIVAKAGTGVIIDSSS